MDTILILIVLLIPIIWFSTEKIQTSYKPVKSPDEYWGFESKPQSDTNSTISQTDEHQEASEPFEVGSGRLYYSIPGRSFFTLIKNGRVIPKK